MNVSPIKRCWRVAAHTALHTQRADAGSAGQRATLSGGGSGGASRLPGTRRANGSPRWASHPSMFDRREPFAPAGEGAYCPGVRPAANARRISAVCSGSRPSPSSPSPLTPAVPPTTGTPGPKRGCRGGLKARRKGKAPRVPGRAKGASFGAADAGNAGASDDGGARGWRCGNGRWGYVSDSVEWEGIGSLANGRGRHAWLPGKWLGRRGIMFLRRLRRAAVDIATLRLQPQRLWRLRRDSRYVL